MQHRASTSRWTWTPGPALAALWQRRGGSDPPGPAPRWRPHLRRGGRALTAAPRAVAAALVALTPLLGVAAPAAAAGETAPPSWTCSGARVSAEQRVTFVTRWSARLRDRAFLDPYLSATSVPPEIEAEGFHALSAEDRQCLVAELYAHLAATVPGFPAPGLSPSMTQALLFTMVFDKGAVQRLQQTPQPTPADPGPAPLSPLDVTLNALKVPSTTSIPAATVPSSLTVSASGSLKADVLVNQLTPPAPAIFVDPGGSVTLPNLPVALPVPLPTDVNLDAFLNTARDLVESATYRVCSESPSRETTCSLNLPLGTPITVDLGGDSLPDAVALLAPSANPAHATGFSAVYTVRRLSSAGPLPGHVYAVFQVPTASRQMRLGFQSAHTLAASSTASFTLKDIPRAVAGDVDVSLDLSHDSAGSSLAVTFGTAALVYPGDATTPPAQKDPLSAALRFTPVPSSFTVGVRSQQQVPSRSQQTIQVQSSVPVTLQADAILDTTDTGQRRELQAVVEKLSTQSTVDVTVEGATVKADYAGAATVDRVTFFQKLYPNHANAGTYQRVASEVRSVPTRASVTFTKPLRVEYSASASIAKATALLEDVAGGVVQTQLAGEAHGVPQSILLQGTIGGSGDNTTADVTYTASASLEKLAFWLFDRPNKQTMIQATATKLPSFAKVLFDKQAQDLRFSFDGRTAPGAAPGSAGIGTIEALYAANAAFLGGTPAEDHLVLRETATSLQAALKYSGLTFAGFAQRTGASGQATISADIRNTSPRLFKLQADTKELRATATVDSVPSKVTLDYERAGDSHAMKYRASGGISTVTSHVERKATNEFLNASITGVPSSIDLTADLPNRQINWLASGPVTQVKAAARIKKDARTLDATADVAGIPGQWELNFNPEDLRFRAGTPTAPQSIGSVFATFTNHGTVPAAGSGQHAIVKANAATGDISASARLEKIERFSYRSLPPPAAGKKGGFSASLKAGNGGPFHLEADTLNAAGELLKASAVVSPLPAEITISQLDTRLTAQTSANYSLNAEIALGTPGGVAAAPAPPAVRGVSLRDGSGCAPAPCGTGLRLRAFLEGAPTSIDADWGTTAFGFGGYRPPSADRSFNADVALAHLTPLTLRASLTGLPETFDTQFGPIQLTDAPGPKKLINLAYGANAGAAQLRVDELAVGGKVAQFVVAPLPKTVSFSGTIEPDTFTFTGTLATPINSLKAFYREGAGPWQVVAELTNVPATFNLLQQGLTSAEVDQPCAPPAKPRFPVPTLRYTASANTLGITAATDPSLFGDSAAIALKAGISKLGGDTRFTWDGSRLTLTSLPMTESIEVHAGGEVRINKDLGAPDPCKQPDSGAFTAEIVGTIDLRVPIKDAYLKITNLTSMTVIPGITTAFQGGFGSIDFGWNDIRLNLDAELGLKICIDLGGDIKGCFTIPAPPIHIDNLQVNVLFHVASQTEQVGWKSLNLLLPCGLDIPPPQVRLDLNIRPAPHSRSWNGFSVGAPPGGAWLVTPDPGDVVPDDVVEALAALFFSPLEKGFSGGITCR